jgi:hypothetical protein
MPTFKNSGKGVAQIFARITGSKDNAFWTKLPRRPMIFGFIELLLTFNF